MEKLLPLLPGCLAMVIKDSHAPMNVGRIVRVLRCAQPGEEFEYNGEGFINTQRAPGWVVEAIDGDLVTFFSEENRVEPFPMTMYMAHCLMRIGEDKPPAEEPAAVAKWIRQNAV